MGNEVEVVAETVTEEKAENGDVYDGEGKHIGTIDAFADIGSLLDAELSVLHEGFLYVFKLDYRTKAEIA